MRLCVAKPRALIANTGNTQGSAPAGGARRQTKVGGKRVKTIDVHCHCVLPETLAMMGLRLEDQRGPVIGDVGATCTATCTVDASLCGPG